MARDAVITVTAKTWTELTNGDITDITFQVRGGACIIAGTSGSSPSADSRVGVRYLDGQGERNAALSDLFPGVSSADRVWAYSNTDSAVYVSHA